VSMSVPLYTNVHVGGHVIAVPNRTVPLFVQAVRKARLQYEVARDIEREIRHDELVELMDGHTV